MLARLAGCTLSWLVGLLVLALAVTLFLEFNAPDVLASPQLSLGGHFSTVWWHPVVRVMLIWAWLTGAVGMLLALAVRLFWMSVRSAAR